MLEVPIGSGTYKVWKLGDPIHSTPTIVAAPRTNYDLIYGDSTYTAFYTKWKDRREVVYVGANDGMLHAFNGGYYHKSDDVTTPAVVEHGWYTKNPTDNSSGRPLGDAQLEHAIREDLNRRAPRVMAVLRPLRVVIENYPEDRSEDLDAVNNPEDAGAGTRKVPFSRVLYIERDDFREDPPKQFFRLAPGREVRLRYAYFVKCVGVVKDPSSGQVTELRCTYDPATRGGDAPDGRKVKATLHWVSADHAIGAEVRLYDHLFAKPDPEQVEEGERTSSRT